MINPRELVEAVNFKSDFEVASLTYNQKLGFLQITDEKVAIDSLRLLGFGTPVSRDGGFDASDTVRPLTEFRELPEANQNIDQQGKGVGPRMYNVHEAFAGAKSKPDTIGVYAFDINPSRLLDGRATQGNKIARIGRHAGRILRSKISGVEEVVAGIHESYGNVDAVELEMPPLPELRQVKHGVKNPENITPQFIIIRNRDILLHKVGETDAPW